MGDSGDTRMSRQRRRWVPGTCGETYDSESAPRGGEGNVVKGCRGLEDPADELQGQGVIDVLLGVWEG